jgi:hypothetical protein
MQKKKSDGKKRLDLEAGQEPFARIRRAQASNEGLLNENLYDGLSAIMDLLRSARFNFYFLRTTLLCNIFVLQNKELGINFPVHGNRNFGTVGGYLDPPEYIFKLHKKNYAKSDKFKKSKKEEAFKRDSNLENKALYLLNESHEGFDAINIRDEKSFYTLNEYCIIMAFVFEIASEDVKNPPFPEMIGSILDRVFHLSIDLIQKYFELIGYQTRRFEEKVARKLSGEGQKAAKEKRVNELLEVIKGYADDNADILHIDKGEFIEALTKTFIGAEKTQRHPDTIRVYKEELERKLGKKIILEKRKNRKVPF